MFIVTFEGLLPLTGCRKKKLRQSSLCGTESLFCISERYSGTVGPEPLQEVSPVWEGLALPWGTPETFGVSSHHPAPWARTEVPTLISSKVWFIGESCRNIPYWSQVFSLNGAVAAAWTCFPKRLSNWKNSFSIDLLHCWWYSASSESVWAWGREDKRT